MELIVIFTVLVARPNPYGDVAVPYGDVAVPYGDVAVQSQAGLLHQAKAK
jgi:hypothetical protein